MRIGLFFDSRTLKPWDWQSFLAGQVSMSGTDAQLLLLAHRLQARSTKVTLFHTVDPGLHPSIDQFQIESVDTAVRQAKELGLDLMIFNNRGDEATQRAVDACEAYGQAALVWDQNGPNEEMADIFAASALVRRVVCVSAMQADNLRHHPVFSKVCFVHNAVDVELFPKASKRDPGSAVFVGAITASKGFHHLAAIWPEVRRHVPHARLTVLGSAELYDYRTRLGPLGVADKQFEMIHIVPYLGCTREKAANIGVFFEGLAPPVQLRNALSQAAVGIVNPNWEGSCETFCVSAVEIQAAGAAVIGGRACGLRETVSDGTTGILISSRKQLRDTLVSLLTTDRALAMGKRGPNWVAKRFTPTIVVPRWESMLCDVVDGRVRELPFSLGRISSPTVVKELYRQARRVPLLGPRLPSFRKMQTIARWLAK